MKNFLNLKSFVVFFAVLIIGLVFPFHQAEAWIAALAANIAFSGIAAILELVVLLTSAILFICRLLLVIVTSPSFITIPYTSGGIVDVGWPIVRDFANLGFTLALIFIGLATALQIDEYGAKKALPRLLAMALLVNFTPVIAGIIVDASNIIMNFFLGATGDFGAIVNLGASHYSSTLNKLGGSWGKSISLEIIAEAAAISIFNLLAGFFFLLYAFLFLMRYVAIWTLVIVSPLAFFAYVFPKTKSYYNQWWQQFIQWCFIGVPASFFLYLSWHLLDQADAIIIAPAPSAWGNFVGIGPILSSMLVYGVVLVFLFLGFLTSLSSGAIGATAIITTAKGWGKSTAKFAGNVAMGKTAVQRKIREKAGDFAKAAVKRGGRELLMTDTTTDILKKASEYKSTTGIKPFDAVATWAVRRAALEGKIAQAKSGDKIEKLKQDPTLKKLLANNDLAGMMTWTKSAPLGFEQDIRHMAVASLIAKEKKEAGLMKVEGIDPEFINKAGDKMAAGGLKGQLESLVEDSPIVARRKQFWLAMLGLPTTPEEKDKLEKNLDDAHKDLIQLTSKKSADLTVGDTAWLEQIKKDVTDPALRGMANATLLSHLKTSLGTGTPGQLTARQIIDSAIDPATHIMNPLFETLMAEHAERKGARGLNDEAVRKLSAEYITNAHSAENFVKTRSDTDAIKVLNVQGPGVFKNLTEAAQRIGVVKLDEIGQNQWVRAPYVGNNRHYFNDWASPINDKIVDDLNELNKHIGMITGFAKMTSVQLGAEFAARSAAARKLRQEATALPGLISAKKTEISTVEVSMAAEKDPLKYEKLRTKLSKVQGELSAQDARKEIVVKDIENNAMERQAITKAPLYK